MTKHMKAINKYIGLMLGVALSLSSCSKIEDMLDRFPKDKLSPETYFASEAEMKAYSNKFYKEMLPTGFYSGGQSDAVTGRVLSEELKGARPISSGDGSWKWTALRDVNTLLEYSGNCKDEKIRNQYVALARFFRAYFYFEKVKMYGDVPWYDNTLKSDDEALYKPRDSREVVMGKMLEDINFAIDNLPANHSDYTITKWTALAFKSRFCLYEGTFRKYHAGKVTLKTLPDDAKPYSYYLEQAADAALKFINTSGYSIYNKEGEDKNYIALFTKYNVSDVNAEVILGRDYNLKFNNHNANSDYLSSTLNKWSITRKMVATYLMKDGSRFTDKPGWENMSFVDEVKDRDPRLAQSIRTPGYVRLGTDERIAPSFETTTTGYCPIKYFTGPQDDTYKQSQCDFILFRAAEVYLNYAEAKAELGTINQDDLDLTIKPLRERVGMDGITLSTVTVDPFLVNADWGGFTNPVLLADPKEAIILEIRRERAVELLGEGFRYYDIIRWAEGHVFDAPILGMYFPGVGNYDLDSDGVNDITLFTGEKAPDGSARYTYAIDDLFDASGNISRERNLYLTSNTSGSVDAYHGVRDGWKWNDDKDYYYPIPIKERTLTQGALTQNPGWDDGLPF